MVLLLDAGCSDSHSDSDRPDSALADAATPTARGACVAHWAANEVGPALSLYENDARGPRAPLELLETEGGDLGWVVHTGADVTGDGVRDLVVRSWYPGAAAVCTRVGVTVFEVNASAPMSWSRESVSSAECAGPYASLGGLGDWDGDRIDDLVAQGFVFVRGTTGVLHEDEQRCQEGGLLGDVDGDGSCDSGCDARDTGGTGLWIVWGGAEGARTMLPIASGDGFAAAGDVNGDGFDDFVAIDHASGHSLVLGRSDREELSANTVFPTSGPPVLVVAPGDVDQDGFDDLVLTTGEVASLHRGGHDFRGDKEVSLDSIAGTGDRIAAAGDANCDGFADLLVQREKATALHLGSAGGVRTKSAWSTEITGLEPVFAPTP